jgi:hypothetical protein
MGLLSEAGTAVEIHAALTGMTGGAKDLKKGREGRLCLPGAATT